MTEPWRDPARYTKGRIVKCGGCGVRCHKTHWGAWCYDCNVGRIERISGALESLAEEYEAPHAGPVARDKAEK